MRGDSDACPSALAILRMPPPSVEQFLDPALMRHALLDETFRQMGATLDLDQMARGLINIVVPHFSNSAGLLLLESLVAADEPPAPQNDGSYLLRRMAIATDDSNPDWDATFPTGEVLRYPAGSPYTECMNTGRPVREPAMTTVEAVEMAESWLRRPMAKLLAGSSMLLLPLNARGATLGFIVCNRRKGFRSFDAYVWQFVGGSPVQNRFRTLKEVPARTEQSDAMSKDLKRRGFNFVGSTICYAYMQAVGMVNDHLTSCFRHKPLAGTSARR